MSTKFLQTRQADVDVREKLAKDLRREHFNFGFESAFPNKSRYAESMKEHKLEQFTETKEEMEKLRRDLRKEHYLLGTDKDPKVLYQTSAAKSFTNYVNPEKSKLSQETKNDLRSCHFTLGYDNKNSKSDYKQNYSDKIIDPEVYNDKKDQVVKLRQHNQVFNDKNNYYSSQYNETTNKQYDKSYINQGKSKEEITNQIVELRKTNLLIGTNKGQFNSEANSEFSNKGYARNDLLDIDLKKTNYVLGTDTDIYKTTVKENFKGEFQLPDNGKTQELVQDLRREHYSLGSDGVNYKSQNSQTYKNFKKEDLQGKPDISALYKTHFDMGGLSDKTSVDNRYTSDYKQQFQQRNRIENKSLRNDRTDRASNICFGSDQNDKQYVSEHTNTMKDFSQVNDRGVLDAELAKDLRGTHYKFGLDQPNMVSQNQETYNDKSKQLKPSQLDAELKKDLRRNHFEYGTAQADFQPIQKDIGSQQGPPSKLNPTLSKQLRSHHFNHGDYKLDYSSSYGLNHQDFTKD